MSKVVGVGRTTLWRRFHDLGIPIDKYSDISDSSLDCLVSEVQRSNPNIGVSMLQGYLKSQSCNVQRRRIRESVLRVCPMRAMVRWHQTISRRSYWVPGPNSLWHIDGHHSLIRWRFVVHGCVDGFSRMIPYLSCCTDNLAATVLRLFRQATSEFGIPSRVRSDRGGENVTLWYRSEDLAVEVTSPAPRYTIKGWSGYGGMFTGVCVHLSMKYFTSWRYKTYLTLIMSVICLFVCLFIKQAVFMHGNIMRTNQVTGNIIVSACCLG